VEPLLEDCTIENSPPGPYENYVSCPSDGETLNVAITATAVSPPLVSFRYSCGTACLNCYYQLAGTGSSPACSSSQIPATCDGTWHAVTDLTCSPPGGTAKLILEGTSSSGAYTFNIDSVSFGQPTITDDPHFVGFYGQHFEVHGISTLVYNLISQHDFQLNARFLHRPTPLLSEYSTWISDIGAQFGPNFRLQANCNGTVALNDVELPVPSGEMEIIPTVVIIRHSKTSFTITTQHFRLAIDLDSVGINEWCPETGCPHIDISASVFDYYDHSWKRGEGGHLKELNQIAQPLNNHSNLKIGKTHGLLGQTVRNIKHENKENGEEYIEGNVADYHIKDNNLFGSDFLYNQFEF